MKATAKYLGVMSMIGFLFFPAFAGAEMFYGTVGSVNGADNYLVLIHRDYLTGVKQELRIKVPDGAQIREVGSLDKLKVGDSIRIEASRPLFSNAWEAKMIEPGERPKRNDFIFGKISSIKVESAVLNMETINRETGKREFKEITVPSKATLEGYDSLGDLRPGDVLKMRVSRDLLAGGWQATYVAHSPASTYGEVVYGQILGIDFREGKLSLQRQDGKADVLDVYVPSEVELQGLNSLADLQYGDFVRVEVSRDFIIGPWKALVIQKAGPPEKAAQNGSALR